MEKIEGQEERRELALQRTRSGLIKKIRKEEWLRDR